jgi:hypothetical protein
MLQRLMPWQGYFQQVLFILLEGRLEALGLNIPRKS